MLEVPPFYDSLEQSLATALELIHEGVTDRNSPLHHPVIATSADDGTPAARVVVLRGFDSTTRLLWCHTDLRSSKAAHVEENGQAAWSFYDPERKIQVRVTGETQVHDDDEVARQAWEGSHVQSRLCYLATPTPGVDSPGPTSGIPEGISKRGLTDDAVEPGYANFAVVRTSIDRLEWLYLHADGHRRAAFVWSGGGWDSTWLVP